MRRAQRGRGRQQALYDGGDEDEEEEEEDDDDDDDMLEFDDVLVADLQYMS